MHSAIAEIIRLHAFFDRWVRAELAESAFPEFADALHGDFTMVAAGGDEFDDRAAVLDAVRNHRDPDLDVTIGIEDPDVLYETGELVVARYVEVRRWEGGGNRRLSTAVFLKDPAGPNGLRWLRVHETYIEQATNGPVES